MQILELNLKHFGKFLEHRVKLLPGMNIIYGGNETGKTTIHAFIRAMFFGIEKTRGKGKRNEYLLRQPWDNPAYFAGSMRLEYQGHIFRIERNFSKNDKSVRLVCEDTGQEFGTEREEMEQLLSGLNEAAFVNTVFIPQEGCETGEALAEELRRFMVNYQESQDGELNVSESLEKLKKKRKALEEKKRQEQELLDEKIAKKEMEAGYIRRDMEHLGENEMPASIGGEQQMGPDGGQSHAEKNVSGRMAAAVSEPQLSLPLEQMRAYGKTEDEEAEDTDGGYPLTFRSFLILLDILLAAGGGLGLLCGIFAQNWTSRILFFLLAVLLLGGGWMAVCYTIGGRKRYHQAAELSEADGGFGRLMEPSGADGGSGRLTGSSGADRGYDRLTGSSGAGMRSGQSGQRETERTRSGQAEGRPAERAAVQQEIAERKHRWQQEQKQTQLQEKKVQYAQLRKEMELLYHDREKLALYDCQMEAVDLAMTRIRELSAGIYRESGSNLSQMASEILAGITEGRYVQIALDENMEVRINTPTKLLYLHQVSLGTMHQVYFSLRMAAGALLSHYADLPLILDEPFAMFDEERLEAVLRWLAASGRQVILFTCQKREKDLFYQINKEA